MKPTLKDLAENAINYWSADPCIRETTRTTQAANYERLLARLEPEERAAKIIDTGHFLIWLPRERLASHLAELSLNDKFKRIVSRLLREAIYYVNASAFTTILESSRGLILSINLSEIESWSDAHVDLFESNREAVKLHFDLFFTWSADLSWQGFLKLLLLTDPVSRETSIATLEEYSWDKLGWLFFLNAAGKLSDDAFSPSTRDRISVNILIAWRSSFRSDPVVNAYIRGRTPEELQALFKSVHPDIAEHPKWMDALRSACEVSANQLPALTEEEIA